LDTHFDFFTGKPTKDIRYLRYLVFNVLFVILYYNKTREMFCVFCTSTFLLLWSILILWTNPTILPFIDENLPKDEFDLTYGTWGIVCGASEGIGMEWAFALAERGLNVVLIGRNGTKLNEVYDSLNSAIPHMKYIAITLDLGHVDQWKVTVDRLAKDLDIGFVVYNAAYSPVGPYSSYSVDLHEHSINLNVRSAVVAISAVLPRMLEKKRGGIVLMSSADGEGCSPLVVNYSGTKAWATRTAEGLWYELRHHGIDVLGVVAGLTTTTSLGRILDPTARKKLFFLETSPRSVVIEALRALGKGQPIVITGLGTKIITWTRWILPRSLSCQILSSMHDFLKDTKELDKVAHETYKPQRVVSEAIENKK
jgi:short-subunit dehydrogenase